MDLTKIIEEAEGLPDEGWNLSLLGSRISGQLQQDIFSENIKKRSHNTRKNRGSLGSYTSIYIKSIIILRVLSCKLYIEDPSLFLRLTKIAHVFIKYSLLNIIKDPTDLLSIVPILGGGKTFIHGKAKKEPSTDDSLNNIILLIIKILLSILPRQNMFKQDKSLLRQLGDLQKSGVILTDEGKFVKANFVTEYPTSVTGRPAFPTNLPFRYVENNEPVFRANKVGNFNRSSSAVGAFSDTTRYMNVSISPEMQESFKTFIIASGFNTSLGESGFMFRVENGFLKILKTVQPGTRGLTKCPHMTNITDIYAHVHPFRWDGDSPESHGDLTAGLSVARRYGIFTSLVFTHTGVITITISNPGNFSIKIKDITVPKVLDWTYPVYGDNERFAKTTIGNSTFGLDIRVVSWLQLKQGVPITIAIPDIRIGVPKIIEAKQVAYTPDDLSFLYHGRSTLTVNQTEMIKWTQELFDHPNMKYFRGLLSTNLTGFHEQKEFLTKQMYFMIENYPCTSDSYRINYSEFLNRDEPNSELERCSRELFTNMTKMLFAIDLTENENYAKVVSYNNNVQRQLRELIPNIRGNTRRVRPNKNGVLNFTSP